jgi:hypothetical protein
MFTAEDAGTHTFPGGVTLITPGDQTVTATDLDNTSITGNAIITVTGCVSIDHANGFADHSDLHANGSAAFVTSGQSVVARITDGGPGEQGSIFTNTTVPVVSFSTTFTILLTDAIADGVGFVIQADPRGNNALGPAGGGLGYGPDMPGNTDPTSIVNSIIVKFDLFNNAGEGTDSTGLFSNGHSPTFPLPGSGDVSVDMTGSPIDLHGGHLIRVELNYDGATLTEALTDTVTNGTFTTTYAVDIPAKLGGITGYVGFTGGTGGATAIQDVQTWTGQFCGAGGTHLTLGGDSASPLTVGENPLAALETAVPFGPRPPEFAAQPPSSPEVRAATSNSGSAAVSEKSINSLKGNDRPFLFGRFKQTAAERVRNWAVGTFGNSEPGFDW